MKNMTRVGMLFLMIAFCAQTAHAAELFDGVLEALNLDKEELAGSVAGIGARYQTSPYIGVDKDVAVIPVIVAQYKKFYLDGTTMGYYLNDDETWRLSGILSPRFMGYDKDDSDIFIGMDDRDMSLDGGLRLAWDNDWFVFKVTAKGDLLNVYQGYEFKAGVSKGFLKGLFTPRAGVKWQNSDLVDYYYGVLGNETTSSRSFYKGKASINYYLGMTVAVPIGEKWAVTGDIGYEGLGDEIKESPVVDARDVWTYVVGAVYRF